MVVAFIIGELAVIGEEVGRILFVSAFIVYLALGMIWYKQAGYKPSTRRGLIVLSFFIIVICLLGSYLSKKQQFYFEKYKNMQASMLENVVDVEGRIVNIQKKNNEWQIVIDTFEGDILLIQKEREEDNGVDKIDELELGMALKAEGRIIHFNTPDNPGNYNEEEYYNSRGTILKLEIEEIHILSENFIYGIISKIAKDVKSSLVTAISEIATETEAGVLIAMIIGDSSYVDEDIKELFALNGIVHIIAVSGLHISLIGIGIYNVLRKWASIFISVSISSTLMIFFLVLIGGTVSGKRAVIMFVIYLVADLLGRKYDLLSASSLSALIMLIDNPAYIYNGSFLLSYIAIVSVGITYPIVKRYFNINENKKKKASKTEVIVGKLKQVMFFNISLFMTQLPLNAFIFYKVPMYSIIINMLVIPLMGVTLFMTIVGGVFFYVSPYLGEFCIGISVYCVRFFMYLCDKFGKLPNARNITGNLTGGELFFCYLLLCIILLSMTFCVKIRIDGRGLNYCERFISKIMIGTVLILFLLCVFRQKNDEFYLCFIDVGQGDSCLVHTEKGNNYLIDCGSSNEKKVGKYKVESLLEYLDVGIIDCAFISHTDMDHISGIMEMIERDVIKIKCIALPKLAVELRDENYIKLINMAKKAGIEIVMLEAGDVIYEKGEASTNFINTILNVSEKQERGKISFECVNPVAEQYADINDNSMVLILSYGEIATVFTGDIGINVEENIEKKVGERIKESKYRILKVAHHGSKNSSKDTFVREISPDVAVISCGKNNSYGHPHSEVLSLLQNYKTSIYRTDKMGAILIRIENGEIVVSKYKIE